MFYPGHVVVAVVIISTATISSADLLFCGNKFCGIDAVCGAESNKCECPMSHPLGDPGFRCHTDDKVSCVLIGDPSLTGFTGDLTFMDFPCKYTLSKFDTPLLSRKSNSDPPNSWDLADPGRDRCRVIIHGTNTVSPKGSYYLQAVNVIISINVGGSSKLETLLVNIGADKASYSYAPYAEVTVEKNDTNSCVTRVMDTVNSIGLSLCFIEESMVWSFGVSICGATYVNFRAWEGISENQLKRPGVSIITNGKTALFSNSDNGYPNTMCDSPFNDADDVYHDVCKKQGIKGKRNCALHAFLSNNPPQQPHYCVESINLFSLCPAEKKVQAANACGQIVTQLAKCVIKNGKDVMNIFEACLVAVCDNPAACPLITQHIHHGEDEDCNSFPEPC